MHVINHNRGPKKVMKIPSVAQQLELLDDNKDPKVNTSVKKMFREFKRLKTMISLLSLFYSLSYTIRNLKEQN